MKMKGGLLSTNEIAKLGALYGGIAGGLLAKATWDAIKYYEKDPRGVAVYSSVAGTVLMVLGATMYMINRRSPNPLFSVIAYMLGTAGAVVGFAPYFVRDSNTKEVLLYTMFGIGYANVQGKWYALGFNALGLVVAVMPLIAVLYVALK